MKLSLRMVGLLVLCLLLLGACAAGEEIPLTVNGGKKSVDAGALTDGLDDTGLTLSKGRAAEVILTFSEEESLTALYVRLSAAPVSATLQAKNEKGKFADVLVQKNPGGDITFLSDTPLKSPLRLTLTFEKKTAATLQEMRGYAGDIPGDAPAFGDASPVDILYIVPTAAEADLDFVSRWVSEGATVQCAVTSEISEDLHSLPDALHAAGCRKAPIHLGDKTPSEDSLIQLIRKTQPKIAVYGGEGEAAETLKIVLESAAAKTADDTVQEESASACGLFVSQPPKAAGDLTAADLSYDSEEALRAWCAGKNADALHADPTTIPYPERLSDGYLPEGAEDFLYEDPEAGLWAYVSQTVQVEIVRYDQPEVPRRWFVSDIHFKPDQETFHQQVFTAASFDGQMTYPERLAQTARMVFGINGDYYIYREKKGTTGVIIRNGEILHAFKKPDNYPNLDCVALRSDGSMSVYDAGELTAYELSRQEGVHDVLSFGPYLVRDGELRIYDGMNADHNEPRNALGMVSPGHYKVITVEGRFSKGYGPAGVNLKWLAMEMYAQGVTEAINLDGGNTAVLIFMGEKLNRTASKGGKAETQSRNMSELFGVGTSDKVHTDMLKER